MTTYTALDILFRFVCGIIQSFKLQNLAKWQNIGSGKKISNKPEYMVFAQNNTTDSGGSESESEQNVNAIIRNPAGNYRYVY